MVRGLAPALFLAATLAPAIALAQVNIDQNKSAAQMYAGNCAVCHKSVRGLANGRSAGALAGFLSEHYTASAKEAAGLAAYVLASGGGVGSAAPARSQPEGEGSRATAEQPKSHEARRPARPEEKPPANAKPDVAGAARKPEGERRAAVKPAGVGPVRGQLPDRRGPIATGTRGRAKPGEAAAPGPVAPALGRTAVVAAPPPAETPNPQISPAEGPSAALPAEAAPVPRDNIPD